jgi:YHS domain-containing protein
MGDAVRGNADSYYVLDGRIYIFGSDECYRMFKENPKRFLMEPVVWKPDAVSLQKGSAMLAELRKAMGIDGMSGWTEKRRMGQSERTLTAKLPSSIEAETKNPRFTFRTSITPEKVEMMSPMQGMTNTLTGAAAKATRGNFARDLFWLVSGALQAVPSQTPAAVDVYTSYEIVTLRWDPATKRPASAQWKGRAGDGSVAQVRADFSDFKPVDGRRACRWSRGSCVVLGRRVDGDSKVFRGSIFFFVAPMGRPGPRFSCRRKRAALVRHLPAAPVDPQVG